MKHTIIAIVGPSGCGKTTLSQIAQKQLDIPALVSYTTRPMRPGETDGVEHWFVSESNVPNFNSMLAYTFFGGNHYWTELKQIQAPACTYVIDEKGLLELVTKFKNRFIIKAIKIVRQEQLMGDIDENRKKRDAERLDLDDDFYDAIIENNGTFEQFIEKGIETIKNLTNYGN